MSEQNKNSERFAWKQFLRQLLISSGAWTFYFVLGLSAGSPTVIVPQIRKEANSTEAVSEEMASWLPAIHSYSGLPWVFILPALVTAIGRKKPYVIVACMSVLSFVVLYYSENVYHILISEVLSGALGGSYLTMSLIIITEYTSPKYRGVFLTIKSPTLFWGVLAANVIGTFFNWRNIALFGLLCSIYSLTTVFLWPESPLWMATRKRFDDCADSHRWLKGSDRDAEKELQLLISRYENVNVKSSSLRSSLLNIIKTLSSKLFYKPVMISLLLLALHLCSGKMVCTVYAIDILKKITKSESTAYSSMLILDGITLSSMYIGCIFSKLFKRRTLLLVTSSIAVVFLYSMSLYMYLIKRSIIEGNNYVSISLLVGFSVAIGCGPMILSTSIYGELIPMESRGLSMCIIALVFKLANGSFFKLAPYCFKLLGIHGMFLLFAVSSSVCWTLIYLYLPETKDKTIQEIADCLNGVTRIEVAKELIYTKGSGMISNSSK